MQALKLGEPNEFWTAPAYSVRVRATRYLWGSAGVKSDLTFGKPFILHVANDEAGQPVTLGTRVAAGTMTELATLQAGECLSIPVSGIAGIYAQCATDSVVYCLIY